MKLYWLWKEAICYFLDKRLKRQYIDLVLEIVEPSLVNPMVDDGNRDGKVRMPRFRVFCDGVKNGKVEKGWYKVNLAPTHVGSVIANKLASHNEYVDRLVKKGYYSLDEYRLRDTIWCWVRRKQ